MSPDSLSMNGRLRLLALKQVAAAVLLATSWITLSSSHPLADSTLGLNEVLWSPEKTQVYIGSPSILRLGSSPNSTILVSNDRFGHGFTQERNVSIFASDDNGYSWAFRGWCQDQYWSNLFMLNETLYLLGTDSDAHDARIKISRSVDGGKTWQGSVLFNATDKGGYNTGPTPALVHQGRVYRALEHFRPPYTWGVDYEAVVISASTSSDLMNPASWKITPPLPFDTDWIPKSWGKLSAPGYLEGNAVAGPDGSVYNVLRFNVLPAVEGNKAIVLKLDQNDNVLKFQQIIDLPGGHTKFVIHRDLKTKFYVTLSNINTDIQYTDQRNILTLTVSPDMYNWTAVTTLLEDDTGFSEDDSIRYTGFHYVDWHFDSDDEDIIYAIRTAYRGAESYHNSNRITFKRLSDWREVVFGLADVQVNDVSVFPPFHPSTTNYTFDIAKAPTTVKFNVTTSVFGSASYEGKVIVSGKPFEVSIPSNGTVVAIDAAETQTRYNFVARIPSFPTPPAAVSVSGSGFRVSAFGNNATAFTDRTYVFINVPVLLQEGFSFTEIAGGAPAGSVNISARADSDGLVLLAGTDSSIQPLIAAGWETADLQFQYTDGGHTQLEVVSKVMKKGVIFSVPQSGWAGVVCIFPKA